MEVSRWPTPIQQSFPVLSRASLFPNEDLQPGTQPTTVIGTRILKMECPTMLMYRNQGPWASSLTLPHDSGPSGL